MEINSSDQQLDLADFLFLPAADLEETKETTVSSGLKASTTFSPNPFISSHENEMMTSSSVNDSCWELVPRSSCADYNMQPNDDKGCVKITTERDAVKIAFRTKSDLEIMDDGYKWRKYGKKKVKNSPNPRNYYKCSAGGCNVKKRVERERKDSRFVITTYEGKHNHESLTPAPAPAPASAHCTSHYTLKILDRP